MVHRVDNLGHTLHIHVSRPTTLNLVLPDPLHKGIFWPLGALQ